MIKSKHLNSKPVASPRLPRNTQRASSTRKSSTAKATQPVLSGANLQHISLDNELNGNKPVVGSQRINNNSTHFDSNAEQPTEQLPSPSAISSAIRRSMKKQHRPKDRPPIPPTVMTKSGSLDCCVNINQSKSANNSPEHIPSNSVSSHPSQSPSSASSPQHSSTRVETSSQNIEDDFPPPPTSPPNGYTEEEPEVRMTSQEIKPISQSNAILSANNRNFKEINSQHIDSYKSPAAQLVSELFESFKMKAQQRKRVDIEPDIDLKAPPQQSLKKNEPKIDINSKPSMNSASKQSKSFLRRFQSKPGPDYPAPAPPVLAQSNRNSIVAEYVTPVLKRPPKPIETIKQNEELTKDVKYSINKSIKNDINSQSNQNNINNNESQTAKTLATGRSPPPVSTPEKNSGYDADDEGKRHSSSSITSLKKLWESQSINTNNNLNNSNNNVNDYHTCGEKISDSTVTSKSGLIAAQNKSQNSPNVNVKRGSDALKSLRRSDNSASADNIVFKINEERDEEQSGHHFLKPS